LGSSNVKIAFYRVIEVRFSSSKLKANYLYFTGTGTLRVTRCLLPFRGGGGGAADPVQCNDHRRAETGVRVRVAAAIERPSDG
jgi:hypothetical protein